MTDCQSMAYSRGRPWEGGQQTDVRIISKDMIIPAKPTHRYSYFLSCFDIVWRSTPYNQRVIFYERATPTSGDGGRAAVVEALKSSLGLCLVHYYPWCGRLSQPTADAAAGDRLFLDCNDRGVEFVEADMDLPISLLSRQGFQTKPFFEQLCQKVDHTGDGLYSSPLLSVQATFFSDGGLSLGVSQSHVVADGRALWDFMLSWGECARGISLRHPPVMDRKVLAVQNLHAEGRAEWDPVVRSTSEEEEKVDQEAAASNGVNLITEPPSSQASSQELGVNGAGSVGTAPPSEKSAASTHRTPCMFILRSSAITQLKIEDGGVHTTYEVICAHFWHHLMLAWECSPQEPGNFAVIANFRGRLNPPLPPSYFGNAIGFGIGHTTAKKVCNGSLHSIASAIHDTIVQTVEESTIKGFMHFVEAHRHDPMGGIMKKMPPGLLISVASSPHFPVYEVDFGWGKPSAVRSLKLPRQGQLVFFGGNPNLGKGDIEICSVLPTDVLQRLLNNPSFLGVCPCDPFEDYNVHQECFEQSGDS